MFWPCSKWLTGGANGVGSGATLALEAGRFTLGYGPHFRQMLDNGFDAILSRNNRRRVISKCTGGFLFPDVDIDMFDITSDRVHAAPSPCPHNRQDAVSVEDQLLSRANTEG